MYQNWRLCDNVLIIKIDDNLIMKKLITNK